MFEIHIIGTNDYFQVEKIDYADVSWSKEEIIKLHKPNWLNENDMISEPDKTLIDGDVLIPKDKITHIIYYS